MIVEKINSWFSPIALLIFALMGFVPLYAIASSASVDVWWPVNGAHMHGVQPFKAMVPGVDVSRYDMFWQVDGGQWNWMDTSYTDYQHKEADVDLSAWTWHGSGPYVVTFIARQGGTVIAERSETIYVDNGFPVMLSLTQTVPVQTAASAVQNTVIPILAQSDLYVEPHSKAAEQAIAWTTNNPRDAAMMQILASQPTADWFGDWNSNVADDVHALVVAAHASSSIPILVAYNIPERDCGGFSAGGTNNPDGYKNWINAFAQGMGSAQAIVILEPDALAQIRCLSAADQSTRLSLLSNAVMVLKADPNAKVYIDAGHSNWIDPATMAVDLTKANVAQADGFSLNVSNFMPTAGEVSYGQYISAQIGGKHFIVDTSRNGNGSNGQWCNPSGMAIGQKPTLQTGNPLVDFFLWVKTPGESDGTCNGGPAAGMWWPDYALQLVQNRPVP